MLVLSVVAWQSNVFNYQGLLQALLIFVISVIASQSIRLSYKKVLPTVVFTELGDWLEIHGPTQENWKLTAGSRVTELVLFVHLVSPLNSKSSQWRLIFKDQTNEQDFRRLCRAIIFQQQNAN